MMTAIKIRLPLSIAPGFPDPWLVQRIVCAGALKIGAFSQLMSGAILEVASIGLRIEKSASHHMQ